jgi:hypothetical protein
LRPAEPLALPADRIAWRSTWWNQTAKSGSVLLGNGDGTFASKTDFVPGRGPVAIALADLNGDGLLDLAVANIENTISILLGSGDGTFDKRADFPTRDEPWALALADLNGDASPDLVVANDRGGTVSVLLGQGSGTFGPKRDFLAGPTPRNLALADLNGDGILDLAVVNVGSHRLRSSRTGRRQLSASRATSGRQEPRRLAHSPT